MLSALCRAWIPLIGCELLVSLLTATLLGPIALALSYRLIGLQDETPLENWELVSFILSPVGVMALMLVTSLTLLLLLLEYSGLIVVADAALRGSAVSTQEVALGIVSTTPRLFALAIIQTSFALVVALPFCGLAAAAYGLLLGNSDINFYLVERPPSFWIAAVVGLVLAVGFAVAMIWFFVRWALTVPACVLDGHTLLSAMRLSSNLMRGRARRLTLAIGGWQLIKYVTFVATIAGLDRFNQALFSTFGERPSILVWSTVALLLLDALVLQLLGAVFTVGVAALIARVRTCPSITRQSPSSSSLGPIGAAADNLASPGGTRRDCGRRTPGERCLRAFTGPRVRRAPGDQGDRPPGWFQGRPGEQPAGTENVHRSWRLILSRSTFNKRPTDTSSCCTIAICGERQATRGS